MHEIRKAYPVYVQHALLLQDLGFFHRLWLLNKAWIRHIQLCCTSLSYKSSILSLAAIQGPSKRGQSVRHRSDAAANHHCREQKTIRGRLSQPGWIQFHRVQETMYTNESCTIVTKTRSSMESRNATQRKFRPPRIEAVTVGVVQTATRAPLD